MKVGETTVKLSQFAKKMNICYQTAWNWYKKGLIPGAYSMETGTVVVPDNVEELLHEKRTQKISNLQVNQ
jgi:predicted site-specific integrase-resolvase